MNDSNGIKFVSLSLIRIKLFAGLGSLLLKNLRFRDLENIYEGDKEDAAEYQQGKDSPIIPGRYENSFFNPKKLAIISGNKNGKEYPNCCLTYKGLN